VIDPLPVLDEFGTDALRFTLLVGSTPGNDTNISLKKVEANRNFANKIWNAGRFVIGALDSAPDAPKSAPDWSLADSWIWARLQQLERDVDRLFETYQYGEAGRQIYDFFWSEFADWYLEIAKLQLNEGGDRAFYTAQTLARVLDACLRLLHPFTPYVTEELWGHFKRACQSKPALHAPKEGWSEALMIAQWPQANPIEGWEAQKIADFSLVQEIISAIRTARAEKKVEPGKKIGALIAAGEQLPILQAQLESLAALAYLDPKHLTLAASLAEKSANAISLVVSGVEIHLPLAEMVDQDAEKARIEKELAEVESQIARLEGLLGSTFAQKAPPAVVEKERQKLAAYQDTAKKLRDQIGN